MLCAVQPVLILRPQSPSENPLVAVSTHTPPKTSDMGQRSCTDLDLFPEEEPTPLSFCLADNY